MERCILSSIRKAEKLFSEHYDSALGNLNIGIIHFSILKVLERRESAGLCSLTDELFLKNDELFNAVEYLVVSGLICVRRGGCRRSPKVLTLTSAGRAKILEVMPIWSEAQESIIQGVGQAEVVRFLDTLEKITRVLKPES